MEFRLKILQRYVLKELFGPFILGLSVFTFVLLANKLFRLIDILISQGSELTLVIQLFGSLLFSLLSLTIPMAILVAVLIGLGRLTIDKELLAARINGINLFQLFRPVILLASFISITMIILNFTLYPRMMLQLSDLLYKLQFRVITSLEPNRFYDNLGSDDLKITLHFEDKSDDGQTLHNLQLKVVKKEEEQKTDETGKEYTVKKRREMLILAEEGQIFPDEINKEISLKLTNGTIMPISEESKGKTMVIGFEELSHVIRPSMDRFVEGEYRKRPREMTLAELREEIRRYEVLGHLKKHERKKRELQREIYQRFSIPLSCLAFVLIGIPLALIIRPSGKSTGFAISFGLLFIYFVILKWGSTLLDQGYPFAWLAMFSPNILLGVLGSVMIYRQVHK